MRSDHPAGSRRLGPAMQSLQQRGVVDFLKQTTQPLLGICLGMQLLFEQSAEDGTDCLGRLPGQVQRLSAGGLKVPHMGWNQVQWNGRGPLAQPDGDYFYFVHSYVVRPTDLRVTTATTDYGDSFVSAVCHETVCGVQFHPERSGPVGLQLLEKFLQWSPVCS